MVANGNDSSPTTGVVDLFTAQQRGDVNIRVIANDAASANILVRNLTRKTLTLQLPETFAVRPVLTQFDNQPGGQNRGNGQSGRRGGTQTTGGGSPAGQQQGQQQGGVLRVRPEKTGKLAVQTVCLEFGKPDPNPRIAYELVPLSEHTDDPRVVELCRELGWGQIQPNVAQAVAWNLSNGVSWEELAEANRRESRYFGNTRLFRTSELVAAQAYVAKTAEKLEPQAAPFRQPTATGEFAGFAVQPALDSVVADDGGEIDDGNENSHRIVPGGCYCGGVGGPVTATR